MMEKILLAIDNITENYIDVTKLTDINRSQYLGDLTDIIFNNTILKNGIGVNMRDERKRGINVKVGHIGYIDIDLCYEYSNELFEKINKILKENNMDNTKLLQVYQEGKSGGRITFEINLDDDYDNRYLISDEEDKYQEEGFNDVNKFMINTKIIPLIKIINDIANLVLEDLQKLEDALSKVEQDEDCED